MTPLEDITNNSSISSKQPYARALPSKQQVEDVCANGVVVLKNCNACLLVKYCSVDCQKAHRKQHKKACKKRAAELKDERLYSQGHERPEIDFCLICTQPVPTPLAKHACFNSCCMKMVCNGCLYTALKRGMNTTCPFCSRTPRPKGDSESLALIQARVDKNDPEAIKYLGDKYLHEQLGLEKDASRSVELWNEAAELGSVDALYRLGVAYDDGIGVQKDQSRSVLFYEKAAMLGHVDARHTLGFYTKSPVVRPRNEALFDCGKHGIGRIP